MSCVGRDTDTLPCPEPEPSQQEGDGTLEQASVGGRAGVRGTRNLSPKQAGDYKPPSKDFISKVAVLEGLPPNTKDLGK